MLRWIIESSLKLRFLVIVLAAALMAFGVSQLREMPVDVFPEFNPPLVEVQTEALGLSAAEVEALITTPMEADLLNGVAWLDKIYSESVPGLSSILMVFEPGTDPIRARQMVQERLTQAHALPNVSKPPLMLQPLSTTNRAMMVGLTSDELSPIEMGVLARWNVKPRLMGVPGVANVAIWGQRERQLQVQVDPAQLQANGVTLDQIIETTGEALWVSPLSFLEASTPGTAGWIDTPNQRLGIRHLLPISSPEDLAKVVVVDGDGLVLGDVATVVEDHQPLIGDAILDGGAGLLLVVEKFPGANTLEVTRGVEEALDALRPGLTGVEIDATVFRPASYIELATDNLGRLLLIGALLLAVVLVLFFLNWRTALISLVTIPLALVTAGFVLYLRGATFNVMVLAGLVVALGVIIDDAIIDVDNVARRLRQQKEKGNEESTMAVTLAALLEMRGPIGYATLIILLAVLPVFFLNGLTGAFFQPLVQSYVLAVLTSLVVALIVTPALSLTILSGAPRNRPDPAPIRGLQRIYTSILGWTVRAPYVALGVAGIIILLAIVALPFMGLSLTPSFKQTDLLIQWEGPPGTSRPEMNRITAQASQELRTIPGVRNVGSHVGRAVAGDAIVGVNAGEIWVSLDPAADYDAAVASIRNVVAGYPGLLREVQTYEPKRLGEALTSAGQDLSVRIYGSELDVLRAKADEVQQVLASVDGVVEPWVDVQAEEPQVEIEVDLARAEAYGVKPGDVRRQATTLLSGIHVGSLFEDQKVFDVVVWGAPEIRRNLTNINELLIDTPDGGQAPLGELADVRIVSAPSVIKRDAVSRYIDVNANVTGRSLDSVAADVKSGLQGVEFPFEYHVEILNNSANQRNGQWRMLTLVLTALIGIYLLMQAAFNSWRMAFVASLTLPMALAGGVFAVFVNGGVFSLGSLLGFFAIFGIAVRNIIVLISHLHHLEWQEEETFGLELVLRGARERLAPVLMTALATAAALLPMAVAGDIAGIELVRPIAVVILGGLITSTLLTLFIVPALYLRFGYSPAPITPGAPVSEQPHLGMA